MFGRRNIRDSVGYVTLGLFAHAVLDELLEASRDPASSPSRKDMIQLAIDSLGAVEDPRRVDHSRVPPLVFQRYQEVHTLRKLLGSPNADPATVADLGITLTCILDTASPPRLRQASCKKTILFFRDLAKQAAMSAEFPAEQVPAGVRALAARLTAT